ncbi:MAG: phosphate acyltransferase PlsX [Nannocystaceae bacterium]
MTQRTIAVDACGSDSGPQVEIEAAVTAARRGYNIILVGDEAILRAGLARHRGAAHLPLRIHHAPDVITMEDSPGKAVRAKPEASMPVCFDLVRKGEAQAVVSAGNSGAMLACGLFKFGRIKGVDRPAIISEIPGPGGSCVLLDMGANVECRPLNLVQFAVMGATFARVALGKAMPVVGVLANGSEDSKGTELTRATLRLLHTHPSVDFDFRGHVEGKDIFGGEVDVIVTDGFTGNITLKSLEATARALLHFAREAIGGRRLSMVGAALMKPSLRALARRLDPDTVSGAPLLGVDGIAIICHGGATPKAIVGGIELADRYIVQGLGSGLRDAIDRHKPLFAAAKAGEAEGATPG